MWAIMFGTKTSTGQPAFTPSRADGSDLTDREILDPFSLRTGPMQLGFASNRLCQNEWLRTTTGFLPGHRHPRHREKKRPT